MDLMIGENSKLVRQDIIQQTGGYNVSDRYVPISTESVLNEIKSYSGAEPKITGFNNANVRKAEKQGFQRHAIIAEMPNAEMIDGTKMNMILFNSNDRSTSLKIHIGSITKACSNQLVWGEEVTEALSIRHTTKEAEWKHSIHALMDEYEKTQEDTKKIIIAMQDRYMSYGDQGRFAEQVVAEIIDPSIVGSVLNPLQLLMAHNKEQRNNKTLWISMQNIQYNIMHGGMDRIIEKTDENGLLFDSISTTHKITDISKNIKMNRSLNNMAMDLL